MNFNGGRAMNFKVMVAASALLICAESARAEGVSRSLSGLSVGAQIGIISQSTTIRQKYNFSIAPSLPARKKQDLGGENVIGGLNLAYGCIFPNHLFLGAEIKGDLSNMGGSISEGPLQFQNRTRLEMNNSFGGALKLGGVISSVLPYFRVGLLSSKWEASSRGSIDPGSGPQSFHGKKNKRLLGLELGLGIDVPLPEPYGLGERLSIGGEYTHVDYKKMGYQVKRCVGAECDNLFKISAKPRTNTCVGRLRFRLN